ncbi:unnamed protein product [Rotaria sordida]|uniref:Acid ceramidase n=1 Tax=Rotaria sordida TaxID=392033 RepID=A0A819G2K2_9BILA|nr:unnamed protein product [Rotaria sordida]
MSSIICNVPSDVSVPPRFVVNLDSPPMLRWQHILRLYRDQLREVEKKIDSMVSEIVGQWMGPMFENVLSTIMAGITQLGLVYYGQELKGFSRDTGMPLGKLVMIQFVYECFACCTSIVCQDEQTNTPMHIRTMDWGLDFLKQLTIDVDFQRNGQTVFKGTTWIGYVGILTGMRVQNGYSVSVNFRHTGGQLTTNLKTALASGWPIGFLVREILESTHNYELAVEQLAQSSIIAPCYFTICGTSQSKTLGTLLTRKQTLEENRWTVSEHGSIIQTNIDHWSSEKHEDILFSIKRRDLSKRFLSQMKGVNEYELWKDDLYWRLSSTYVCCNCGREFDINDNPGGNCVHTGAWHATFNDCSYLKCGFHLGKKASIGIQHWSCCYSLKYRSDTCTQSNSHTFIKQ